MQIARSDFLEVPGTIIIPYLKHFSKTIVPTVCWCLLLIICILFYYVNVTKNEFSLDGSPVISDLKKGSEMPTMQWNIGFRSIIEGTQ